MERFREILFTVWREACQHIEIGESTATIAKMLVEHIPLAQVIVRRFDRSKSVLETVAIGLPEGPYASAEAWTHYSAPEMRRLTGWARHGQVIHEDRQEGFAGLLRLTAPPKVQEDILAGALAREGAFAGVLLLIAAPGKRFDVKHAAMAEALLEPFSVALENDHRLREMAALREAAEADRQSLLNRLGRKSLDDVIVGADSGLKAVMERVALVAPSDIPVLLLGETGTGKELVSRAIHRRSPRAAMPIIRVNCGAIPPELIDSQLFGHERGAFTGAVELHQGWFERADGGTLFLDEVGELPLAAQVRLLRILQDGWLERIGGRQSIHVDVRVVAATHTDLALLVAQGRFREDLFYRVAVFPLVLPPLRERVQDIPVLARHFAERAAVRYGLPVLMPSDEDIALLASYTWPGNVRELGTVMDRAAILGNGKRLEVQKALGVMMLPAAAKSIPVAAGGEGTPLVSLDEAMRRHIETALTLCKGRIEGPNGAAALLKINPHTLRARMRKLGVPWVKYRRGRKHE